MAIVRRSTGLGVLLLSVLGMLACLAAIFGTWGAKRRLDPVVAAVFGTTDDALDFVVVKLDQAQLALDKSQQRVRGISSIAERLKQADANAAQELEPVLRTVDDVLSELKTAQSWLDSGQLIATRVSKLSDTLVSSDYAAAHPDARSMAVIQEVQKYSEAVAETLARVQAIHQELIELRSSGQIAREVVIGIIGRVADLDGRLANLSGRIDKLSDKVAQTRTRCVALGKKVQWWSMAAAITLTVVWLWFGLSQIRMMSYGWELAHATADPEGTHIRAETEAPPLQ